MRGHYDAVAEIGGRLVTDGDKQMTRELALHLHHNGFSQPLGEIVPLAQAFPNGIEDVSLQAARPGSIFDPATAVASKNFSVAMPDGSFVPMLGHDAFGGKVNRFGMGARRFALCNYNWTFCIMQPGFSLLPASQTPSRARPTQPPYGCLATLPPQLDSISPIYGWPSCPA